MLKYLFDKKTHIDEFTKWEWGEARFEWGFCVGVAIGIVIGITIGAMLLSIDTPM